jgi:diguanylate cyclase (GGDEF)-like protein
MLNIESTGIPSESNTAHELLQRAIAAADQATYCWDIASDHLAWSANATDAIKHSAATLDTGRKFAALLDSENLTSRYDAVMNSKDVDEGQGVPYHLEYQLRADPQQNLPATWVEDTGRWFGDKDGRPVEALGTVRLINERHRRDQQLSIMSHTDVLTGMMNRGRMEEALAEVIAQSVESATPCAFAVASIRNLDVVNEAYGFGVADEVIAVMAERLRSVMRNGDAIARYSGSKFGVILNNCSAAELPIAAERFLNVARDSVIETSHGPVWALLSFGAVRLPEHATTGPEAKALAEEALSQALRHSSDGYVVHQPSEEINTARMINTRCAAEIVECLHAGKFQLAYQPIINATTGAVVSHEALLRMMDGAGELVAAAHLVPVAERLGLIRLVDRAVVQLAIEALHKYPDAHLSVNISATTANDGRWNSQIIELIETAETVASRMTVEITETTALTDLKTALQFLERLRNAGCTVAIDDFGAGFTSFRNLRDLPVDIIKLDGSYCRGLAQDSENVYFARTLVDMAHHFGIRTVAEWVENASDAEILTTMGIDYLQGNYFGEPSTVAPWQESGAPEFQFPVAVDTPEQMPAQFVVQQPVVEEPTTHLFMLDEPETALEIETVTVVDLPSQTDEIEITSEVIVEASAPSDDFEPAYEEVDASLARLRDALNQLSSQFGQFNTENEAARLAG